MVVKVVAGFFLISGLIACGNNRDQKPLEVIWGRDIGKISAMVVSDPRYAVQVIEKSGRRELFVEIGTAVKWISSNSEKGSLKIWVNDFRSYEWIDAKTAHWKSGFQGSPMGFGFRAFKDGSEDTIPFIEVQRRILSGKTLIKKNRNRYLNK